MSKEELRLLEKKVRVECDEMAYNNLSGELLLYYTSKDALVLVLYAENECNIVEAKEDVYICLVNGKGYVNLSDSLKSVALKYQLESYEAGNESAKYTLKEILVY